MDALLYQRTCAGPGEGKKKGGAGKGKLGSRQRNGNLPASPLQIAQDLKNLVARGYGGGEDAAKRRAETEKQEQRRRMKNAADAKEYRQAADRLDMLEGNYAWKFEEDSQHADMALIRNRLDKLKRANHAGDMEEMLSLIRNDLKRDLGAMCNVQLYLHCHTGTKHLIDEWTDIVKYTIERLLEHCETASAPDVDRYLHTLKAARQSFGNSALMLSGGGTLGMCHIGVVKCLVQEGLLPRIVCGSSAGSIVGAVLATQKPDIVLAKLDELCCGDVNVFQDQSEIQGVLGMSINILMGQPGFEIRNLCRVMQSLLGDITFKEAYNRTGMVLNIHVSSGDKFNLPRLLNYITAPNVLVWTAVASSCSLPLVFRSRGLLERNPETKEIDTWGHPDHQWIDGSIAGDLPARVLERLFNVNHFIASQVNPHVATFLPQEGDIPTWCRRGANAVMDSAIHGLSSMAEYFDDSTTLKMLHSIFSQTYTGDITILPDTAWTKYTEILANPDQDFMRKAMRSGEEATWPKLDRIKNTVAVELALDRAIKHIHGIKVGNMRTDANGTHRSPSSTRSEYGMSRRSSGSSKTSPFARSVRGRSSIHRAVKSMVEPSRANLTPAHEQFMSSSDETTASGYSSPVTSYNDEDFDDLEDDRPTMNVDAAERAKLAFLSQPASPSLAYKAFHFPESSTAQLPSSPELRRVFNDLQMSAIYLPDRRSRLEQMENDAL